MKIEDEKMPDYRKGRVMGVDERGNEFFLPKAEIHVGKTDVFARLMAAGALVVASGGVIYHFLQPKIEDAIQNRRAQENLIGDCVNENIVRQLAGEQMLNFQQCKEERARWYHQWEENQENAVTSTPEPTGEP